MSLVLTRFLDAEPDRLAPDLPRAVAVALDAAAARVELPRVASEIEELDDDLRVRLAGDLLDGSVLQLRGRQRLTTVEVTVPWAADEASREAKLLAANRFTHVVATEVRAAA